MDNKQSSAYYQSVAKRLNVEKEIQLTKSLFLFITLSLSSWSYKAGSIPSASGGRDVFEAWLQKS